MDRLKMIKTFEGFHLDVLKKLILKRKSEYWMMILMNITH